MYALVNVAFSQLKLITWVFVIWIIGSSLLWFLTTLIVDPSNTAISTVSSSENSTAASTTADTDSSNAQSQESDSNKDGGYLYFSQTIAFVGYGLIPIVLAHALHIMFLLVSSKHLRLLGVADMILGFVTLIWSTYSCSKLVCSSSSALHEKRRLIWWPVCLLYLYFLAMHK